MPVVQFKKRGASSYVEGSEQIAFMQWLERAHPDVYDLSFHIPNERQIAPHKGALLNKMGRKAGVPDIFIACSQHGYNGLFIEMKSSKRRGEKNPLTPFQEEWLLKLNKNGYATCVCCGFEEAQNCIKYYLSV